MSRKRESSQPDGLERRKEKRQKLAEGPPPPEEIVSARQLQQLLIFSQDNLDELRNSEWDGVFLVFTGLIAN